MGSSSDKAVSAPGGKLLRGWIVGCAVAACLLVTTQLLEMPWRSALRGYDNTFNYLWLRSAMVDGDWDFRNDLAACNTLEPEFRASALALAPTPAGRIPNKYGTGWAVLTLPFYLVADGITAAGRALGWWTWPRDGFNPVYQTCIQIGHVALALLALWLAAKAIAAWLGDRTWVPLAVLAVWAASPLLYYQTANIGMAHGAAFFAVALCAYALVRARDGARWWWLLAGAGWGLAVTTRFQLGVFGLLAAWYWWDQLRQGGRIAGPVGWFAAGAAPLLALQLWAWHVVYGRWLVFSYGGEGESFHWTRPELFNALCSPWHGLFYWHPLLLVAALGLLAWAWRARGLAAVWVAVLGLTLYINAAWWCWWFASAFGGRAWDAALLALMAGFAWLLQRAGRRGRAFLLVLAGIAALWNFYLITLYRTAAIPRNEPVTWGQMIEAAGKLGDAAHF
ncbi:MAG: hypothetical protein JSS11_02395 [Verrucomicrobia bacterium]|nr:hypothetical protein [Verrucomicrobiota bacterium]